MRASKNKLSRLALLALTAASLTACASYQGVDTHSSEFGTTTAHNRAVQEVKPTEEQKNNTFIPADASRQALAREKYRTNEICLLYTSPSPRDQRGSRMPSSA